MTSDGQQLTPGKRYQVVYPNGATVGATSEWDAIQKQAMFGGAIQEIGPNG